jgi:hypothetical protein
MASVVPCMYCRRRADSLEHILGTKIVDTLAQDPRGLPLPMTLHVADRDGVRKRSIRGRRTKRGLYTVEFTTPVCQKCNNEWMERIDTRARQHIVPMIRDEPTTVNANARAEIADWMTKVALTAHHHLNPGATNRMWTDWLRTHNSALPDWHVWIGRYVGAEPLFFVPEDIRVEALPGSVPFPKDGMIAHHGVLATLVIGYLALQIFGIDATGYDMTLTGPTWPSLLDIWPTFPGEIDWPPSVSFTDTTLWPLVDRLKGPPKPSP